MNLYRRCNKLNLTQNRPKSIVQSIDSAINLLHEKILKPKFVKYFLQRIHLLASDNLTKQQYEIFQFYLIIRHGLRRTPIGGMQRRRCN